jgi:hypothetical protein
LVGQDAAIIGDRPMGLERALRLLVQLYCKHERKARFPPLPLKWRGFHRARFGEG